MMIFLNKLALVFSILLALQFEFNLSLSFDWELSNTKNDKQYKIVCYYTNWAQYRPKPGTYFPEDVDPNLCTHIIYAFAKINDNSELQSFEWNDESTDWAPGMYQRTVNLKKKNKDLKVLIAVGGWNHGSLAFSNMVSDDMKRQNFITKTVEFLKKNGFDGLDLDWEYPANRDTEDRPDDKLFFTILCKELHAAFKHHNFILTAAVAAGVKYINSAYEIAEIHKYLDFINLMAYDLHGGWDNVTGHNGPLYAHEFDRDKTLNVDHAIKVWTSSVPPEKMVLGVSAYGRSFKLREGFESCPLTDTPVSGAGSNGKYSREAGFMTYYEVCEKIFSNNWKYIWNDQQKVPFAHSSEILASPTEPIEWVGFDDVRSIEDKVKYVINNNLGGAMIWSLDMDDFTGTFCNQGKYPILSVMNHYLNSKYKVELPKASVLWNAKQNNSSLNYEEKYSDEPISEDSYITPPINSKLSATGFFSSNNVFGLIQNNVMQVYKFCQCKNGTHKINTNHDLNDKYSFTVDCNTKTVTSPLGSLPKETDDSVKPYTKVTPKVTDNVDDKIDKNTIWSIFGINSSAAPSYTTSSSNYIFPKPEKAYEYQQEKIVNLMTVCYLSSLFKTRSGLGRLNEEHLEKIAFTCTHVIYSYVCIDPKTYDKIVSNELENKEFYQMVSRLKRVNPDLKIMLSVGSYKEGTVPFLKMAETARKRRDFVRNTIKYLKKYDLDGVELNWNIRNIDLGLFGNSSEQKRARSSFSRIVQQFKDAFKPFNLVLSAMVSGINDVADHSYEIDRIHTNLDFITVMSYDFYEIPLKFRYTMHHSPLYSSSVQNLSNSLDSSIFYWIKKGFPKEKILLGVDLYAKSYSLFNSHTSLLGSAVRNEGSAGYYTQIPGVLSYFEVCDCLYEKDWVRYWLEDQSVPYAFDRKDQVIFYEDWDSITLKTNYIRENKLAGIAMFGLESDDFSGRFCMQGNFPLIKNFS